MNKRFVDRAMLGTAVALGASALLLGFTRSRAATDDWRPDAWITTKAKIALLTSDQVSGLDVDVDTTNGSVILHGTVDSDDARAAAGDQVSAVDGVRDVRNLLQVVPPEEQAEARREDQEIQRALDTALDQNPKLSDSDIEIRSVNAGVVLLGGEAADLEDRLVAIRTARGVEGVTRVVSEISGPDRVAASGDLGEDVSQSANTVAQNTKDAAQDVAQGAKDAAHGVAEGTKDTAHDIAEGTKDAARSVAQGTQNAASATAGAISDAWITTKVKSALIAEKDAPFTTVNVDTSDGEVTLFGSTETPAQRATVERVTRSVDGVSAVRNLLQVVTPKNQEKVARTDAAIDEQVEDLLEDRSQFDAADIDVEVVDGVVRLSGSAPDQNIRLSASSVARSVGGVRSVENDVRVAN